MLADTACRNISTVVYPPARGAALRCVSWTSPNSSSESSRRDGISAEVHAAMACSLWTICRLFVSHSSTSRVPMDCSSSWAEPKHPQSFTSQSHLLLMTETYQLVGHLHGLHHFALLGVGYAWPQSPFGSFGQDFETLFFSVWKKKTGDRFFYTRLPFKHGTSKEQHCCHDCCKFDDSTEQGIIYRKEMS